MEYWFDQIQDLTFLVVSSWNTRSFKITLFKKQGHRTWNDLRVQIDAFCVELAVKYWQDWTQIELVDFPAWWNHASALEIKSAPGLKLT